MTRSSVTKKHVKNIVIGDPTTLVCQDDPYPHYEPGKYTARCVGTATYRDPRFRAWKCRLDFAILPDGDAISRFYHLGTGSQAEVRRGSEYRREWIIANGEQPRKRQTMSLKTFEDKVFQVRVGDNTKRYDGREHPRQEVYSTVKEILARKWP